MNSLTPDELIFMLIYSMAVIVCAAFLGWLVPVILA